MSVLSPRVMPAWAARTTASRTNFPAVVLRPHEVDAIVVAGMGTRSIIAILEQHTDRAREATTIVLQPTTEKGRLRDWLASHDFAITEERVATERGRDHLVLAVAPVPTGHLARPGPHS
jgi:tRNA A22 N-methylase